MKYTILSAVFVTLMTSVSYAQVPQSGAHLVAAPQFNPDSAHARDEARIVALKAELKLSSDQETKWLEAEAAMRRYNAARLENILQMRNHRPSTDPMAALDERVENISLMANSLRTLSTALKPLYATLNEEQKRKLMSVVGFAPRSQANVPTPGSARPTGAPPTGSPVSPGSH